MHGRLARVSLFGVTLMVGMLLVGQLRSQARPIELNSLSAQELSALIETLSSRNSDIRAALLDASAQVRDYQLGGDRGESALIVARADLERINAFAGLIPVKGPGVSLDIEGSLDPIAVNDLINELRNSGAEAIAVDGVRITARSVASQGTVGILIDEVEIGRHFQMQAIGSREGLLSSLNRPGGIISQLELFVSASIVASQQEHLELPGTRRDLAPKIARPVE
ncbi:MAG: DUF881 domain-containing protein [Chloroflexota bacterium]|nr:DUF881 domain-containing protein [Chloroflexota bacterium]